MESGRGSGAVVGGFTDGMKAEGLSAKHELSMLHRRLGELPGRTTGPATGVWATAEMNLSLLLPGLPDLQPPGFVESGGVAIARGHAGGEPPDIRAPPTRRARETGSDVGRRSDDVIVRRKGYSDAARPGVIPSALAASAAAGPGD